MDVHGQWTGGTQMTGLGMRDDDPGIACSAAQKHLGLPRSGTYQKSSSLTQVLNTSFFKVTF